MKKLLFLLLINFVNSATFAQQSADNIIRELNKTITLYSADNASLFAFYEQIGTIEQKTNSSTIQRIRLADIGFIKAEANSENFVVNIRCADSTFCMNLIKSDMNSTSIPSNAFFFTEASAANLFAKKMEELVALYITDKEPIKAVLLETPNAVSSQPKVVQQQTTKAKVVTKSEEESEEEELSAEEKQIANKERLEKQRDQREEARANAKAKQKSKQQKTTNDEDTIDEEKEEVESNKRKKNNKSDIVDEPMTNPMDIKKVDGLDPMCQQLMNIIKAGKQTKFKEIEGKETNPTTKINESNIRIKGAKRNYLSWFRNQRAFIAEYKTSSDRELILIEFEKLQTELENCLEGGWEDIDHSRDEMYSSVTDEVKDVEYKSALDSQLPRLRIMLNTDKTGKHTLFIRIQ